METKLDFDDEITDEELAQIEKELMEMAGPLPLPAPPSSEDNMQSILQQAKLETLAKEAGDFARDGVSAGVKGVFDTLVKLGEKPGRKNDRKEEKDKNGKDSKKV